MTKELLHEQLTRECFYVLYLTLYIRILEMITEPVINFGCNSKTWSRHRRIGETRGKWD